MQAFRDLLHGWLGKSLLALLIVPFAIVGIESYFVGGKAAPAAKVNDEDISQNELDRMIDQQRQRLLAGMGQNPDASRIDNALLRQDVLKGLVDRALLSQQAQKAGFLVDDATINRLIQETPAFQENGTFSPARYEQILRTIGEDPRTFPTKAKREVAVSQLAGGISQTAFVTGTEIAALSALDNQKRDVHIALVPAAAFLPSVQVSDAEVEKHYKANNARYTSDEKVALDYVVLGADTFLPKVTISDADIEARYADKVKALASNEQRRAAHILISVNDKMTDVAAQARIRDLEKRVKAGEDFGTLAKQFSQDPGSATNNGDLGFAGHGMFVPEFEKSLFSLKVGEVSPPVKTQYGYHLIKLLEVQKAPAPALADLRPELEQEAKAAKAEEMYSDAVEKLDALAYESSDLQEAARQYGLTVQTTPLFTRQGGDGLAANRKLVQTAFSDDLLKDGKNSTALALDDKHSVWIHVNKHEPARLRPLAEVAPEIRLTLQQEKAGQLAKAQAEAIAKALNDGKSAAEVAAAQKLQWLDFLASARGGTAPAPQLLKVAFRLPTPGAGRWSAEAAASGTSPDYAVVAVSKVEPGVSTLTDEQKKQYMGMLASARGQQEIQDYIAYLRNSAKITAKDAKTDSQ